MRQRQSATKVAHIPNDPTRIAIYRYEAGTQMQTMPAPDRRVGLFHHETVADVWNGKVRTCSTRRCAGPLGFEPKTRVVVGETARRFARLDQPEQHTAAGDHNTPVILERTPLRQLIGCGAHDFKPALSKSPLDGNASAVGGPARRRALPRL
jgi:hypothetical protein